MTAAGAAAAGVEEAMETAGAAAGLAAAATDWALNIG